MIHQRRQVSTCKIYILVFSILFLVTSQSFSQSASSSPASSSAALDKSILLNRLCKSWHMDKMVQGGKTTTTDDALKDFVLVINDDHTVKQGLNPDGLIKGTWSFDEKAMTFTVKDDMTGASYPMKINSISATELVLQDTSSATSIIIYYKLK